MGEIAADRAAIADGGVRDISDGLGQKRRLFRDLPRGQQIGLPRQRANPDGTSLDANAAKARNAGNIDEKFRRQQAHIQRRHKTLPASNQLRALPMPRQKPDGLLDARHADVIESRSLHWALSFP